MRGWYAWCERLFSQPPPAQPSAWEPQRMEYAFHVAAGGETLEAPEHDGHHLDWYSFTRTNAAVAAERERFARTVLTNPVTYPGMPAARWWQTEDAAVDFGAVAVGASELLTLLFVEFVMAYGNDWFTVPLDRLPAGSLCRILSVKVTDCSVARGSSSRSATVPGRTGACSSSRGTARRTRATF